MFDSFVIKLKNYFSVTPIADITSFINIFEKLMTEHITTNMKEQDKDYFTKELTEKYLLNVLRQLTIYKKIIHIQKKIHCFVPKKLLKFVKSNDVDKEKLNLL